MGSWHGGTEAEFHQWDQDNRLRCDRSRRRYKRFRRRRCHLVMRGALATVIIVLFAAWAAAGYVSELIGSYR